MAFQFPLSLLPVFFFLIALFFLDTFKLVKLRKIVFSIFAGCVVATAAMIINSFLFSNTGIDLKTYSRYAAPVVEETLKAAYLIYLIRMHKTGFFVDSALHGFAVGAGFALIENIYYLTSLTTANPVVWIVRGFGTAIMHGGVTAIFAIVAKSYFDRQNGQANHPFLFGLFISVALHSFFNHFVLSPLLSTGLLMILLPVIIIFVFNRSEAATRHWLGTGFDTDQELLDLIKSGNLSESRVGKYLSALKTSFPGELVADMLCLLRLQVELAIRAKGELMMQEIGFRVEPDPEIAAKFSEIKYLEKNIGKTGKLTIAPFLHTSSRDLWQLYLVGQK
ncbi:MAG: PrsW family intramembrane metalloprotease [bacterium]